MQVFAGLNFSMKWENDALARPQLSHMFAVAENSFCDTTLSTRPHSITLATVVCFHSERRTVQRNWKLGGVESRLFPRALVRAL